MYAVVCSTCISYSYTLNHCLDWYYILSYNNALLNVFFSDCCLKMMQNSMQLEVTAAINLIAASLYNKLPRRRVDAFAEEVEKGIVAKFEGHWYPDNPSKGAAYRCINVSGEKIDPLFIYAAVNSGINMFSYYFCIKLYYLTIYMIIYSNRYNNYFEGQDVQGGE